MDEKIWTTNSLSTLLPLFIAYNMWSVDEKIWTTNLPSTLLPLFIPYKVWSVEEKIWTTNLPSTLLPLFIPYKVWCGVLTKKYGLPIFLINFYDATFVYSL